MENQPMETHQGSELARTLLSKGGSTGRNLFERTVESLGSAIKHGVVRPGDKLPSERELAEMMGISRSTVRSAIHILVEGGFLVSRRGRGGGTFVADMPPQWSTSDDPENTFDERSVHLFVEKRRVIECGLAEIAAERRSNEDLTMLRAMVGEMAELTEDFEAFRAKDAQFHLKIAQVSENPDLIRLSGELQDTLSSLLGLLPPSSEALLHSNQQHAELVSAIAKEDNSAARRTMNEHVGGTKHFMKGLLPG